MQSRKKMHSLRLLYVNINVSNKRSYHRIINIHSLRSIINNRFDTYASEMNNLNSKRREKWFAMYNEYVVWDDLCKASQQTVTPSKKLKDWIRYQTQARFEKKFGRIIRGFP